MQEIELLDYKMANAPKLVLKNRSRSATSAAAEVGGWCVSPRVGLLKTSSPKTCITRTIRPGEPCFDAPKRPQTHLQGYYLPQKLKVEVIDWPSMSPDLT